MSMILRLNFIRGKTPALALGILVTIFRLAPGLCCGQTASSLGQQWLAPCALSLSCDGRILYAATARSPGIIALEVGSEKTRRVGSLADEPTGIALRDKPAALIVTCSGVGNWITLLEPTTGKQLARWPARPGVCSPVVSVIKNPRALVLSDCRAYAAEFFLDSISQIDLAGGLPPAPIQLSDDGLADTRRMGEMLFHDATLSYQSWQSCASCHPDGRADGSNWDLLNDGIGNPKNTKSLLLAHQTPPAMSLGVRETAEQAVRSGLRHILFAVRAESEAAAIDEYLKALRAIPSPWLVNGKLSPAAKRGQRIFESPTVGCSGCHPGPLFTDQKRHAIGTESSVDRAGEPFDTPTLIECWRTAPYLHNGSAVTVRELLRTLNRQDRHGRTSHLAGEQIDELAAYVLSL